MPVFTSNNALFLQYAGWLKRSKKVPLMAPLDSPDFIQKQVLEAEIYQPWIQDRKFVLDIGSGAGFPGIPLAIVNPSIHFILLDKRVRNIKFLADVVSDLKLINAELVTLTAEELYRSKIKTDAVMARAVSRIFDILSWSMPVLETNGLVILGKKKDIDKELQQAETLPFSLYQKIPQPFGYLVIYKKL